MAVAPHVEGKAGGGQPAGAVVEIAPRRKQPVKGWAALGFGIVILNFVIYVPWLASGPKPAPRGTDPIPAYELYSVYAFEALSITVSSIFIFRTVRACVRERRITVTAAFVCAWVLNMWLDPFLNYIKPAFFYNAYFLNVGCWCPHTPGWNSPNGELLGDDLIGTSGIGYLWFALPPLAAVHVLRRVQRKRGQLSIPRAFCTAVLVTGGIDLFLEAPPVYLHLWGYPSAVHWLSLWGGTSHQFPIYEPILWGSCWAVTAVLMFRLDDRGNTVMERGIESMTVSRRHRDALRVLAVTGAVFTVYFTYNVLFLWVSQWENTDTPPYPSYMRSGICGEGTGYPCPGKGIPIPTKYQKPALN